MTESRNTKEDSKQSSFAEEERKVRNSFLARVSHELRSPLNAIIGFAELMYHGKAGPVSTLHKEYLGDILSSSRYLLVLINDMLDLAKVESGKMEFHPEKIDVKQILNETRIVFEQLISSKKIHFEVQVDPGLKSVRIDPARFKQVIYNYVSNALKCTPEGGHVILRARPENEKFFRLEVEDTGVGIQEKDYKQLFVEFKQLNREIAKQYPSSGLGLALTKHIVESQDGKVGFNSVYGKGSTFFATLPLDAQ